MPFKCERCNNDVQLDSEMDDQMRSSMAGAIGYGFDPSTMIAMRCESCGAIICLRCVLNTLGMEYGSPEHFKCRCGGLMSRQ